MKTTTLSAACAAALLCCGAVQAAGITLYGQPEFSGRQVTFRDGMPQLSDANFQDQASSARIDSGRWEMCTEPGFRGECVVLGPGDYQRLDDRIFHRVESLRPVDERRGHDRGYANEAYEPYGQPGSIELYARNGFRHPLIAIDHDSKRVDLNGGVSSIVVNDGVWELCSQVHFDGRCRTYRPGRYDQIDPYYDQIKSIRRVG